MELKCATGATSSVSALFELNLYGIEIRKGTGLYSSSHSFELNLYGIEIFINRVYSDLYFGLN